MLCWLPAAATTATTTYLPLSVPLNPVGIPYALPRPGHTRHALAGGLNKMIVHTAASWADAHAADTGGQNAKPHRPLCCVCIKDPARREHSIGKVLRHRGNKQGPWQGP